MDELSLKCKEIPDKFTNCYCKHVEYDINHIYSYKVRNCIDYLKYYDIDLRICFIDDKKYYVKVLTKNNILKKFRFEFESDYPKYIIQNVLYNVLPRFVTPYSITDEAYEILFKKVNFENFDIEFRSKMVKQLGHKIERFFNSPEKTYPGYWKNMWELYSKIFTHFNINNDNFEITKNDTITIDNHDYTLSHIASYFINYLHLKKHNPSVKNFKHVLNLIKIYNDSKYNVLIKVYKVYVNLQPENIKIKNTTKFLNSIIESVSKYPESILIFQYYELRLFLDLLDKYDIKKSRYPLLSTYLTKKIYEYVGENYCQIFDIYTIFKNLLKNNMIFDLRNLFDLIEDIDILKSYIRNEILTSEDYNILITKFLSINSSTNSIKKKFEIIKIILNLEESYQTQNKELLEMCIEFCVKRLLLVFEIQYIDYLSSGKSIDWKQGKYTKDTFLISDIKVILIKIFKIDKSLKDKYYIEFEKQSLLLSRVSLITSTEEFDRYLVFVIDAFIFSLDEEFETYCPFENNYLINI